MSTWAMLGLLILCGIVAWLITKFWADVIAGPPDRARHENTSMIGWWFYDGQHWWRDEP